MQPQFQTAGNIGIGTGFNPQPMGNMQGLGDLISGLGYATSGLSHQLGGGDIQLWPGGLGAAMSGTQGTPWNPSITSTQEPGQVPGTNSNPYYAPGATNSGDRNQQQQQQSSSGDGAKQTTTPSDPSDQGHGQGWGAANRDDIQRSIDEQNRRIDEQNRWQQQISAAYQPGIDEINKYITQLPGQQEAIQKNLTSQQTTQQGDILGQVNLAKSNVANQQTNFEQQAQNAWDQANQTYNYGKQDIYNQFGGRETGSAGEGMARQLAIVQAQRFGQLQQQKVTAENQFKQATSTIDTQLLAAHNDLAQKYTDATVQLQDEFNQRTQALQSRAFETQAQKTNAMISNLQQTIANAQAISANFNAAKLQLGAVAAQTYAIYAARGFQTPDFGQFFKGIQSLTQLPTFNQPSQPTDQTVQGILGNLYVPGRKDQMREVIR